MTSDHAAHAGHSPEEIDRHVKVYISVFVALMVLPVATTSNTFGIHE